jgi:hypothetical protein
VQDSSISNSPNRSARSKEDKLKIKKGMNFHANSSDDEILEDTFESENKRSSRKSNFMLMGHSLKHDNVDKYLINAHSELEKISSQMSRRSTQKNPITGTKSKNPFRAQKSHQTEDESQEFKTLDKKFEILKTYKLEIKKIRTKCHRLKCKRHFNGNVCQHLREVRKKMVVLDRELFDDFRKKNLVSP